MRRRSTIEDVARLAGVGKVTVSYVLNGQATKARIKQETCDRIIAAARELEYRPNEIARSLVSRRSNSISVVFQYADYFSAGSSFINEAMRGICEGCVDADVNLLLQTRSFNTVDEEAHALMDGRSDGVLVLRDAGDPLVESLSKRDFPMVLFFSRPHDRPVPFVDADNFAGGKMAAQHLLQLGHTHLSMVVGSEHSVASTDRLRGFREALADAEIPSRENDTLKLKTPASVGPEFIDWVRSTKPTALFCWSDDVAFACMQALTFSGFKLPDDLSIIGFDSSEACERVSPPLTSIRQPVYEMARAAATLLVAKTRREEGVSDTQIFPLTLDVRESTLPFIQTSAPSTKRIL